MISQVSPVIFPFNWAKVADFARNSVFRRQMAKNFFKNPVSAICFFRVFVSLLK